MSDPQVNRVVVHPLDDYLATTIHTGEARVHQHVPALTVTQWLPTWDDVEFDPSLHRRHPPDHFLVFSADASTLRRLTGIQRRETTGGRPRASDHRIQRSHDKKRSDEIADYVKHGFPWSTLTDRQRRSEQFTGLTKPGWLPSSIVINILLPDDVREGASVHANDVVTVQVDKPHATLLLPDTSVEGWKLSGLAPIEIIDGQHRLWAFSDDIEGFEVPVVAFHGLDRSWQAYLFYTINISPKRINASLAYDLYPLLRTEDWLEKFGGHVIYRETRAQELTEALWAYEDSPWYQRINMLGERGQGQVSQASWIRNLISTLVKSWEGPGVRIGGLFGAPVGTDQLALPWNRAQQAAFLILAWDSLAGEIMSQNPSWATSLDGAPSLLPSNIGMESPESMLNSDMGVRGFLHLLNDLCYLRASELELHSWSMGAGPPATSAEAITEALRELRELPVGTYVAEIGQVLATYDWRSSRAPGLDEQLRRAKARFRGSGGYRELRQDLLEHVVVAEKDVSSAAAEVQEILDL